MVVSAWAAFSAGMTQGTRLFLEQSVALQGQGGLQKLQGLLRREFLGGQQGDLAFYLLGIEEKYYPGELADLFDHRLDVCVFESESNLVGGPGYFS